MFKKLFILGMLITTLFGQVRELTDDNFEKATARNLVVVEFYATWNEANKVILLAGPTASGKSNLAIKLAYDSETNRILREETKISANKYLYNNLKALKEFEQFLEETHVTAQFGNKLKDRHKIRV